MNSGVIIMFVMFIPAIFIVAVLYYLIKNLIISRNSDDKSLIMLQNQISEISKSLDSKLGESNKAFQHQFSENIKIISSLTEKLTRLDETNKRVISITDQLKDLQDILKNPKQRGVLGEYYLETVLKNVFPPNAYKMQYKFSNGEIVDAVIFVKDKIIPIDSKFSLENYNRVLEAKTDTERERFSNAFAQDIKLRVDETSKYVRPEENTTDFAFMFIPSEAIYYDLLVNKVGTLKSNMQDIISYASGKKKVIIVSPTTFFAYLQTVLQGLKAMQIEESAKEIKKRVEDLGRHLISYQTYLNKLGANLNTTVNSYNFASKEFKKVDKDVLRITGDAVGFEDEKIAGPDKNEDD